MNPKFSIITPTWNRAAILPNMIRSVQNQTFTDWELLIMDDGSTDNTQEILEKFAKEDSRIKIYKHDKPRERVISQKELMAVAEGDWIYWLDSDDEIVYVALEVFAHNIALYPETKVFNFGQIIFSLTGTTIKLANDLPEGKDEGMGHFDTGRVGTGGFLFRRDCLPHITPLPDIDNPFDLANWFGEEVKKWWAETNQPGDYPRYNRDDRFCGNPWGNDYCQVWLLTRKFKSKKIPINPYIAMIRTENWMYEFADMSGVGGYASNRRKE